MKVGHINGPVRCQDAEFFCRKPAVARDVGQHFFRGLSRKAPYSGANHGPEGQNIFMDGHKVHDVAGFPAVGGGGRFVCRKVHGVQDITEKLIPQRGKKAKGAVVDPFEPHSVARILDLRFSLCRSRSFSTRA
jgi:hypothetical protein